MPAHPSTPSVIDTLAPTEAHSYSPAQNARDILRRDLKSIEQRRPSVQSILCVEARVPTLMVIIARALDTRRGRKRALVIYTIFSLFSALLCEYLRGLTMHDTLWRYAEDLIPIAHHHSHTDTAREMARMDSYAYSALQDVDDNYRSSPTKDRSAPPHNTIKLSETTRDLSLFSEPYMIRVASLLHAIMGPDWREQGRTKLDKKDLQNQIHVEDLEEMDLVEHCYLDYEGKKRCLKNTRRKLGMAQKKKILKTIEPTRRTEPVEATTLSNALVSPV
ncbi:hypothetical protein Tco_1183734 [Tanacetum coccineum]